jgi:hypothetical protein
MLTFSQFLLHESDQIADPKILEITNFVISKAKSVLSRQVPYKDFVQELGKTWNFYYPSDDIRIRFTFDPIGKTMGSYKLENNEHVINLNLDHLYQGDLNSVIQNLSQTLIHELQHINSPGSNGEDLNSVQGKLKFYSNLGEVESHAKQFGYLFHQYYPGNQFNLSLLLQLYSRLEKDPKYSEKDSLYKILLYAFPTKTQEYQESTPEQKQKWTQLQKTFTQKITDYVERLTQ